MRTTFLTLITTAALIVVAGAVVMGQSPATTSGLTSSSTIIDIADVSLASPGILQPDATRTVYREHGRVTEMTFDSSDARLSGEVTSAGNRLVSRDGSFVEAESYVIANDGGRWFGQATGRLAARPGSDYVIGNGLLPAAPDHQDVVLLRGEGGYEGLSAVVDVDWSQEPLTASGTIYIGELPTAPEVVG